VQQARGVHQGGGAAHLGAPEPLVRRQSGPGDGVLRGPGLHVPGRVDRRRPLHGVDRGHHVAGEGDHHQEAQRGDHHHHGPHLERDRLQPHAHGAGLVGPRDPAVGHRGLGSRVRGRHAGPLHHRGLGGLQHVRHHRAVRVRGAGRRDEEGQAPARLLRHGHLEHLRLHLAVPDPVGDLARRGAGVGGAAHLLLLPHLRAVRLGGRPPPAVLQVRVQALPHRQAARHDHRDRGGPPTSFQGKLGGGINPVALLRNLGRQVR